jgi:hypothetical protein
MEKPKEQVPDTGRLWNEHEAARYLGVSVKFLQQDRAKAMRIAFVKIGRSVRYDPADLIAYKDRCKFGGFAAGKTSHP